MIICQYTLTYRRRHSHLSPTTLSPIADDTLTYRRRHSHLSPTTLSPIDRISDGNTWFKRPRNQGSNQVSNQVYNQAINQEEKNIRLLITQYKIVKHDFLDYGYFKK